MLVNLNIYRIFRKITNIKFSIKLFILLVLFFMVYVILIHMYLDYNIKEKIYDMYAQKALLQSREISTLDNLKDAINARNLEKIYSIMDPIVRASDADFITIGDKNHLRLYHKDKSKLNKRMLSDFDNYIELIEYPHIVSMGKGTLGYSLRAKVNILNQRREIIGVVSVGYLINNINTYYKKQIIPLAILSIVIAIFLLIFSLFISLYIKVKNSNLEPKDISMLLHLKQAILESVFEGLIAIDLDYKIISINKSARDYLKINNRSCPDMIGLSIFDFIENSNIFDDDKKNYNQDRYNEICYLNEMVVIASRVRIRINDNIQGWVVSFRDQNNTNYLSLHLSQIKKYADDLRVIRHEYLNKISTLSGLLNMGRYEQAKNLINSYSLLDNEIFYFLTEKIKVSSICGLLLGKYSRAMELDITLNFDLSCHLEKLPSHLDENGIMSIIGNLLDNAFEATIKTNDNSRKKVGLYLSDVTDEILIEVSDLGIGIKETEIDYIFDLGETSKDDAHYHGIGLYLVKNYVGKFKGTISIDTNDPYGTIFSIFIPKQLVSSSS